MVCPGGYRRCADKGRMFCCHWEGVAPCLQAVGAPYCPLSSRMLRRGCWTLNRDCAPASLIPSVLTSFMHFGAVLWSVCAFMNIKSLNGCLCSPRCPSWSQSSSWNSFVWQQNDRSPLPSDGQCSHCYLFHPCIFNPQGSYGECISCRQCKLSSCSFLQRNNFCLVIGAPIQ